MTNKTPWHLWLVGVIAVLFNAIGAFDHVMSMVQGERYMASVGMTPAQIAHYRQLPIWMMPVWAIGVWGAMLGSVLILLRNKLAPPVFGVSVAAFLLNVIYTYVLTDGGEIMGRAPVAWHTFSIPNLRKRRQDLGFQSKCCRFERQDNFNVKQNGIYMSIQFIY
jgi:hypothetical protein